MTGISPDDNHVVIRGVQKRYGGVVALGGVDVVIQRGEIHALVGENGAGKSTLGKIIAGSIVPDGGSVTVDGRAVRYRRPSEAIKDGIAMIDQELAILPHRSVVDNVFLGTERSRFGTTSRRDALVRYAELTERYGFQDLDAKARAGDLRVADQQRIEIMRALARQAKLIVMDEPTAPLSRVEAENLHTIIRDLRNQGTTVVFVSHFLDEVLCLADTTTILKDGLWVRTTPASTETKETLVLGMLGRSIESVFPEKKEAGSRAETVLSVTGLTRAGVIEDVSLEIRAGEIVGLAGLVGSGRTETARAIFGADAMDSGTILLDGEKLAARSPRDAIRRGIALVPESRKTQGLLMGRSVRENISLTALRRLSLAGIISRRRERAKIEVLMKELGIKAGSPAEAVSTLSGGNQQKVALAKWLVRSPRLLIIDEPTRGVDVGAKSSIYQVLQNLAAEGMAILVISSELEEILGLADRTYVMSRGRIVREFTGDLQAQEEAVLAAAFNKAVSEASNTSDEGAYIEEKV